MLPPNASSHSKKLYHRAVDFLKTCPQTLCEAIAVSGSVARGVADEYSDCEVAFWSTDLRPAEDYKAWLESLGQDVKLMRESPDGDMAL